MLYKAKVPEMLATQAHKTANFGFAHFPFQENCLQLYTLIYFLRKKKIAIVWKRKQEIKNVAPVYEVQQGLKICEFKSLLQIR